MEQPALTNVRRDLEPGSERLESRGWMVQGFAHGSLLRARDGSEQRVTPLELFFDLVFAVTQLSHRLLENVSVRGALEKLLVVWSAWVGMAWITNGFDPDRLPVRLMLASLFMSVAIPEAFGERGLMFALAYVAIQVGRSAFVLAALRGSHPLSGLPAGDLLERGVGGAVDHEWPSGG